MKYHNVKKAIFNLHEFMQRLANDEELAKAVINEFLNDMPKRIRELKNAIKKSDIAIVTIQAHSIMGAASYIGSESFMNVAGEVEWATQSEDWDTIIKETATLENTFERLKKELQKEFCEETP